MRKVDHYKTNITKLIQLYNYRASYDMWQWQQQPSIGAMANEYWTMMSIEVVSGKYCLLFIIIIVLQ